MDISSLVAGYSKALYSTWIYYKSDNLLIDCGEGAATALGNGVFGIERVLLTHGHIDHISGLPALLWSRAAGMGDNEKPLQIFHPRDDLYVADMKAYLQRTSSRLPFALEWIALGEGDSVPLHGNGEGRGDRHATTFATRHIEGRLTLGYSIMERRRRLKAENVGLTQDEIRQVAQTGGPEAARALSEDYEATLVVFGGDGLPLPVNKVAGCDVLWHEATILDAVDRKHQLHSTLDEAVAVAAAARPGALVLYHVSGRYRRSEIQAAAMESARRLQLDLPVWCLFRDRLWQIR